MRNEPNMSERMLLNALKEIVILRKALKNIGEYGCENGCSDIAHAARLHVGKMEDLRETPIKYVDLQHCPKCDGTTGTFRHPYARVWCYDCGFVLREEGDQTIQHRMPATPSMEEGK